jgi:hypothetical protein
LPDWPAAAWLLADPKTGRVTAGDMVDDLILDFRCLCYADASWKQKEAKDM